MTVGEFLLLRGGFKPQELGLDPAECYDPQGSALIPLKAQIDTTYRGCGDFYPGRFVSSNRCARELYKARRTPRRTHAGSQRV